MIYPENTPLCFNGQKAFVERFGDQVWAELCDKYPTDMMIRVAIVAHELSCLKVYKEPVRYLRVVLHAIWADYENRKEDYGQPPYIKYGKRLDIIKL